MAAQTEREIKPVGKTLTTASAKALTFVETALQQVCDDLSLGEYGNASIHLRRLERYEAVVDEDLVTTKFEAKDHQVRYSWPGKTADEAWRFACAVAILNAIHAALTSQTMVTKRDIFYEDPELFGDQSVVDRFIDDIAHTCQVPRSSLHVSASPKGLFISSGVDDSEPQTIPSTLPSLESIDWILVVEKEASFNTLCENKFHGLCRVGPGVIVTAKGYPDLATRQFLRTCLSSTEHATSLFGIFDYDTYGIDILKCYRVGSKASAGERTLSIPEMQWLGLKSEDIVNLSSSAPILALTQSDRRRAAKLMTRMTISNGIVVEELRDCQTELQRMLVLNRKAEIQVLKGDFCAWAEQQMLRACAKQDR